MKFNVICCDPPWSFKDQLSMSDVARGASANYSTMSIADLKALQVKELSSPDGTLLALWVPSSLLQEGLDIMKAWGFNQKQTYIWVKNKKVNFLHFKKWIKKSILKHPQIAYDKFAYVRAVNAIIENISKIDLGSVLSFGMGRLFRQTHEICLIGTNNNKIYKLLKNKSQRSISFAENLKHSAKPEDLQNSLELMFPDAKYLELFARRARPNWTCIGNECPTSKGEDVRDSIVKLIKD